jgi:hypothetical protein
MATSRRTGMPVITDTIAVTMATPADGPLGSRLRHVHVDVLLSNAGGSMPNAVARIRT